MASGAAIERGDVHDTGRSALPLPHAFVVQFSADASPRDRRFSGRAEHVVTGDVTHFATLEELLTFVAAHLTCRRTTR